MSKHHELSSSPETCHWGAFDAKIRPVLEVESGDRVTIHTVSGAPEVTQGEGIVVRPELKEIHQKLPRLLPGHILTGPVAVK
ncbi:MAG: amidase, partial [Oceanibaculum sp.]